MTDFISPFLAMQPRDRRDVALSLLLQSIEDARRDFRRTKDATGYIFALGKHFDAIFARYDQYTASVFQPDSVAAEHAQIGEIRKSDRGGS